MSVAVRVAAMLAVLALGALARQVGLLGPDRRTLLNRAVFYVALPALVFSATHDRALGALVSVPLLGGLWISIGAALILAWALQFRSRPTSTRSVAVVQSYHTNFGYVGLPFVAATLGSGPAGIAAVILGVGALTQTPLTLAILVGLNDADATVARQVRRVGANPVVLSLAAGVAVAGSGVAVPGLLARSLGLVGATALPLALLLVGASVEPRGAAAARWPLAGVLGVKLLAMPAVAWVAFDTLGATGTARTVGTVMVAAPTAVSTFVYAGELGGDREFASVAVVTTTVLSLPILTALVLLV